MPDTQPREISRRSVAKGAAWAAPAVTIAAAAPALAASPVTPTPCAPVDCGTPLVSALQVTANVTGATTADVRLAGAITAVLTPCLGLFSVGLVTLRSASITWKSEANRLARPGIPATTTTVTQNLSLALGVNAAGVVAIPVVDLRFQGLTNLQNGLYTGAVELGSLPSRPTKLCFTLDYTRILGGGLPPQECTAELCINTVVVAAVGSVRNVPFVNTGAVTFTIADIGGTQP